MRIDHKPRFAVLLASRNSSKWIEEQINSIINQKLVKVQIIVCIDKSADNTESIVKNLVKKKNIKLIKANNFLKKTASKNFFWLIKKINLRKYDYISFSDHDDIWFKNKLFMAYRKIKKFRYAGYSSNVVSIKNNIKKKIFKNYSEAKFDYLFESGGPGCTIVLNKQVAISLKLFISKHWKKIIKLKNYDWFIYAFCRANNYNWVLDSKFTMFYRQHENNYFGANNTIRSYLKRFKLILNNWYKDEVEKQFELIKKINPNVINVRSYIVLIKSFFQLRRKISHKFFLFFLIIFKIY